MIAMMLLALIAAIDVAHSQTEEVDYCVNTDERERIRALLYESIDEGLKEYTLQLFGIMIKDPVDQPRRAIAGMKPAVVAYAKGRRAIANWNPPICEVK